MDKKTNKAINGYLAAIATQYPRVLKAYLFGSYAKRLNQADSDIDIALVVKNLKDTERLDLQVQFILLATKFNSRIEPHPISTNDINTNNPFIIEIKKAEMEIDIRSMNRINHSPKKLCQT